MQSRALNLHPEPPQMKTKIGAFAAGVLIPLVITAAWYQNPFLLAFGTILALVIWTDNEAN